MYFLCTNHLAMWITSLRIPMHIPHSANFSRDKIFADCPLANFRRNEFRGWRIHVSHSNFRQPHALFVLTMPSSAARFQIEAFLLRSLLSFACWSSPTTPLKPEMPAHWQMRWTLKKLMKAAPKKLETFALKQQCCSWRPRNSNSAKVE